MSPGFEREGGKRPHVCSQSVCATDRLPPSLSPLGLIIMNTIDQILLGSWKSYIKNVVSDPENKDKLEICKQQIKSWAISKLTNSYCNPEILLLVLKEIESC